MPAWPPAPPPAICPSVCPSLSLCSALCGQVSHRGPSCFGVGNVWGGLCSCLSFPALCSLGHSSCSWWGGGGLRDSLPGSGARGSRGCQGEQGPAPPHIARREDFGERKEDFGARAARPGAEPEGDWNPPPPAGESGRAPSMVGGREPLPHMQRLQCAAPPPRQPCSPPAAPSHALAGYGRSLPPREPCNPPPQCRNISGGNSKGTVGCWGATPGSVPPPGSAHAPPSLAVPPPQPQHSDGTQDKDKDRDGGLGVLGPPPWGGVTATGVCSQEMDPRGVRACGGGVWGVQPHACTAGCARRCACGGVVQRRSVLGACVQDGGGDAACTERRGWRCARCMWTRMCTRVRVCSQGPAEAVGALLSSPFHRHGGGHTTGHGSGEGGTRGRRRCRRLRTQVAILGHVAGRAGHLLAGLGGFVDQLVGV